MNQKLPDVQARFRKRRKTRAQIANTHCIIAKAREFQKSIYSYLTGHAKAFHCVDHNKLWKNHKEIGIPDHHTCLLRNLHAGQETTVITRHGTKDWFKIWRGVCQGYTLLPCLFKLYAEYIMQNARIDESQAGIKMAGRNNNLRYANDTTLMGESEEDPESLDRGERGE